MSTAEQDMNNKIQSVKYEMNKSYENIINEINDNQKFYKAKGASLNDNTNKSYNDNANKSYNDINQDTQNKTENYSRTKNNTLNKSDNELNQYS